MVKHSVNLFLTTYQLVKLNSDLGAIQKLRNAVFEVFDTPPFLLVTLTNVCAYPSLPQRYVVFNGPLSFTGLEDYPVLGFARPEPVLLEQNLFYPANLRKNELSIDYSRLNHSFFNRKVFELY